MSDTTVKQESKLENFKSELEGIISQIKDYNGRNEIMLDYILGKKVFKEAAAEDCGVESTPIPDGLMDEIQLLIVNLKDELCCMYLNTERLKEI